MNELKQPNPGLDPTEPYFVKLTLPRSQAEVEGRDPKSIVLDLTDYKEQGVDIHPIEGRVVIHDGDPLLRRINIAFFPGAGESLPLMRCASPPGSKESVVSVKSPPGPSDEVGVNQYVEIIVEPDEAREDR